MRINRFRPTRGQVAFGLALILWSAYWAAAIFTDLLTSTELGRSGDLAAVSGHQLFEVAFTAAHGGVRWLAGAGLILLIWGATRLWNRRRAHASLASLDVSTPPRVFASGD